MNNIRSHFYICAKTICVAILSLLGFDSSSEVRVMYGMPVGDFEIKGAVSAATTGLAVKNAQIKAKYDNEANQKVISIARSDSAGNFVLSGKAVSDRLQIICTPMDTLLRPDTITVNLTYRRDDTPVSSPAPQAPTGYRGSAKKTVDFSLRSSH